MARAVTKDLAFLETVRNASPRQLAAISRQYAHKSCPTWKATALLRAWSRLAEAGRLEPPAEPVAQIRLDVFGSDADRDGGLGEA